MRMMKTVRRLISWCVWGLLALMTALMVALRLPAVQQWAGGKAAAALGAKLGTEVSIGRVDLGFLNRLILDDVTILDQQRRPMVRVARLTAKVDLAPLALGRISVQSAQIFGAHLQLSRPSAGAEANYQFALDSLASADTTSRTPLDLRVGSFIMRHSSVSYDQLDAPPTEGRLNPRHLSLKNISAHVILKALRDDSLNVNVKRLTAQEQSGLDVRHLALRLVANRRRADLQGLQLQLPHSTLTIDSLTASYDDRRLAETLRLRGSVSQTSVTPADLSPIVPELRGCQQRIALTANVSYQDRQLTVERLLAESAGGDLHVAASGRMARSRYGRDTWQLQVDRLEAGSTLTDYITRNVTKLPDEVLRLGDIQLTGHFEGDAEGTVTGQASVATDAGQIEVQGRLTEDKTYSGHVRTEGVDIGRLTDNGRMGTVAADLDFSGKTLSQIAARGRVDRVDYDGTAYTNIELDAAYADHRLTGWMQIADPKLTARTEMDVRATTLNDAVGVVTLQQLHLPEKDYHLEYLRLEADFEDGRRQLTLNSDFAHADLTGDFDYTTLLQSVANAVGSKLPTLPGLPPLRQTTNNFSLNLMLGKTDWLKTLTGADLDIGQPVQLKATVNDYAHQLMVHLEAPSFTYDGNAYRNGHVSINAPGDTMFVDAAIAKCQEEGSLLDLSVKGHAADNNLSLALAWNNNDADKPVSGLLNATSRLYRNFDNQPEAHVSVLPSTVVIDNSLWQIEPSDLLYSTDRMLIDHFYVHNGQQEIKIDGTASRHKTDSVTIDLQGVEVAYILDLVNFDAVAFSGKASGKAFLSNVYDSPDAFANLQVNDFKFEDGRMGTLNAHVDWNKQDKQIDIHATAHDGPEATTYIDGYVSPDRDYIDLAINARGTYLDFMHSYTSSFISHITGHGNGELRLAGPLSAINLTGGLRIDGEATFTPLNTTYWLRNDTITMVYNEILLDSLPIYDKYDNVGYLSGAVHHKDLTNLSLDLHVDTDQLLAYDFPDFTRPGEADEPFFGTVYAAGTVDVAMKGNDVNIDCNVTPLKNSFFVYNAANPDAISNQEFIVWKKRETAPTTVKEQDPDGPSTTNIYMNFMVNATPEGTMRILMDAKTNDYITLHGNGSLRASYYNKGTFEMFGTYTVTDGTYDVTIQNIINKKFQFQPGGTIIFGGDPYAAALNLQALYTVNGVSLSDLQMGNSFSQNTVRVNCLMNIGGQPSAPQVTFDLDMPNVNADEKQMVRSLLSSQQEMNQQVLYLLGIGRFYNQGQNNASQQQQDQTSLAMQSFLSGTLSTQINNVLNQVIGNDSWNFGANISTGTEGWNNAEYEGIVNGRLLNNRLLINGQFGYRDNNTQATPSFIGDFDIRYLLTPTGNLALKVYNQTNDRYFTRSSLNTQGVGIILKKDFNGLNDFFGIKKKDKTQEDK